MERIIDALYPRRAVCAGCGDMTGMSRDWLCDECRRALAKRWIGAYSPPGELLGGAAAAYCYEGPAARMVRTLKYGGAKALAVPMARPMISALEAMGPGGADCVVAVPMHPRRLRRRGYNQAALLAEAVAAAVGLPVSDALARIRDTPQQAMLPDAARFGNVAGVFEARAEVAGRRVLLVDDVLTTGATANACAAALLAAGAAGVFALTFAASRTDGREKGRRDAGKASPRRR